ncbi:MAG TPA: glycosyltransferase [Candidatus Limnocylindrales bacterium]|nr:glycosyltransferase [Candidatus Limnocylindrales bacterium]
MDPTLKPKITVVLLNWHESRQSEASHDVLIRPLSGAFTIATRGVEWGRMPQVAEIDRDSQAVVFFQTPPPAEFVRQSRCPVTWIPMWDSVYMRPQRWWNALPPGLRVVAFSGSVAQRARAAGLPVFDIQYFCDPDSVEPVTWDAERVALYWNRTGLLSRTFLERFCAAFDIDRLLYKNRLDPGYGPAANLHLPAKLGKTRIEEIAHTESREEYFRLIRPANVVLAPRAYEGIGLTFLESLARGSAVFACNSPTMNEYITHGVNGLLYPKVSHTPAALFVKRGVRKLRRVLRPVGIMPAGALEQAVADVNWQGMAGQDLAAIGNRARADQAEGAARWQQALANYARFLVSEQPEFPSLM